MIIKVFLSCLIVTLRTCLGCDYLYLTESAQRGNLILNWDCSRNSPPDTIALIFHKSKSNATYLTKIRINNVLQGWHETNYSLINQPLPGNWDNSGEHPDFQQLCYPYYIASLQNNTIIEMNCFKIQPSWMKNFSDLRIGELMIPGTHDSGAIHSTDLEPLSRWALAQNRNFWQQLVYGIRFFDLRVSRRGNGTNHIYLNHGIVKCGLLLPELQSVAKFLELSPTEVVILNFHEVTSIDGKVDQFHTELLEILQNVFGDQFYPYSSVSDYYGPTLKELQSVNKRLIISYVDRKTVRENSWLWPDITRYWGDKQYLNDLENYIINVMKGKIAGNPLSSIMAELTPSLDYIIEHFDQNLKYLADLVNRRLDKLIRDNNLSNNINIIATDYFTGTDMINIALESNLKKLYL